MKADEFDRKFDSGAEDMTPLLDLGSTRRPGQKMRRVNVDFPPWMVESLDAEATRLGVTRQSIIKVWIAERLQQGSEARSMRGFVRGIDTTVPREPDRV